jgi:hypothetical protein
MQMRPFKKQKLSSFQFKIKFKSFAFVALILTMQLNLPPSDRKFEHARFDRDTGDALQSIDAYILDCKVVLENAGNANERAKILSVSNNHMSFYCDSR